MAESTLSLALTDLTAEVGHFLGWGRGPAFGQPAYNANKQATINSILTSALRRVYFQATLEPGGPSYSWSWMQPVVQINLLQGNATAVLPDDFGGLEGEITVTAGGNSGYWPLRVISSETLRQAYAAFPAASGRPVTAALTPVKGTGLYSGQRFQLNIYPAADMAYTLGFQYYLLPDALTIANPYAYGGAAHAETFKAAARSAAEMYIDNEAGVENQNFLASLAASITYDRRNKPQTQGYNSDLSDGKHLGYFGQGGNLPWWAYGRYGYGIITIGGMNP